MRIKNIHPLIPFCVELESGGSAFFFVDKDCRELIPLNSSTSQGWYEDSWNELTEAVFAELDEQDATVFKAPVIPKQVLESANKCTLKMNQYREEAVKKAGPNAF